MEESGTLYLIPTALGNIDPHPTLTPQVQSAVEHCRFFVVEKPKSAVRFLGRLGGSFPIEECTFVATDRLTERETLAELIEELSRGRDVGVMSEAGCPGVADPGSLIVRAAHLRGIRVVPLVGPASIILALMASGFNGQSFAFHGYLPTERGGRLRALQRLEQRSRSTGETQIFIEAPHRNDHLFTDIIATCRPESLLCVALDLTLPGEYIKADSMAGWAKTPITLGKRPAIFLLSRPSR